MRLKETTFPASKATAPAKVEKKLRIVAGQVLWLLGKRKGAYWLSRAMVAFVWPGMLQAGDPGIRLMANMPAVMGNAQLKLPRSTRSSICSQGTGSEVICSMRSLVG